MAAFLDFRKAFDYVDPDLLLRKLFHYGFDNNALSLLRNYFTGRSQQTRLGTCFSDFADLLLGVPQGSILGPLLFLIFINDFSFYCISIELLNILFADDTTPYIDGSDISHLINVFVDKFKLIAHWINHNSLILNYDKTKFMFITNKHVNYPSRIKINSHTIEVVDSFVIGQTDTVIDIDVVENIKLLGITIDNKLIFSNFFKNLSKKVLFKLYCIKRLIYLPLNIRVMFFKSFILPHFDYCSSLFVYFSNTLISRIESLFNSVVFRLFKIDLKSLTLDQQYSLLSEMNILPFRFRLFYRFSTFCFKIMNNICLHNIKTRVCHFSITTRPQRTASLNKFIQTNTLNVISTRTKSGEHSLSYFLVNFINRVIKDNFLLDLSIYKKHISVNFLKLASNFNSLFS